MDDHGDCGLKMIRIENVRLELVAKLEQAHRSCKWDDIDGLEKEITYVDQLLAFLLRCKRCDRNRSPKERREIRERILSGGARK